MFWIVANFCLNVYGAFPLLGTLRAALAVIEREGKFLVIHRNDGRGMCLPGGLCNWREPEEVTVEREVGEETGLAVTAKNLILRYYSEADFPCNLTIFRVESTGDLRNSWEGSPRWLTIEQFEPYLVESQRPVLDVFRQIIATEVPNRKQQEPESRS